MVVGTWICSVITQWSGGVCTIRAIPPFKYGRLLLVECWKEKGRLEKIKVKMYTNIRVIEEIIFICCIPRHVNV